MNKLTLLFSLLLMSLGSFASHVTGGNVSYECIGPNQFLITLTIYEDCATAFTSSTNQTVSISNDCGITGLTSVSLTNIIYQNQIAPLCPADLPNSSCNAGIYEHFWQGVVTLPAN